MPASLLNTSFVVAALVSLESGTSSVLLCIPSFSPRLCGESREPQATLS